MIPSLIEVGIVREEDTGTPNLEEGKSSVYITPHTTG